MKLKNILLTTILIMVVIIFLIDNEKIVKKEFIVEENGSFEVYFCPESNCSNIIQNEISSSKIIHCAFYDLDEAGIISTLKIKKNNLLIDDSNYENFGTPIKSSGLMHNKFCILDDEKIITGSFNPTSNNKNNNNLIIIESSFLSKNYLDKWFDIKNNVESKTKYTKILYNNYTLKNYFCPEDNCKEKIIEELSTAKKSIHFLTFTFTDKEIANILIEKNKNGLKVTGLMEKFQNHDYSVYDDLIYGDVNVTLYSKEGIQHNKIFIIDGERVVTGSYNPTKAANEKNDENIVIIQQRDIVEKYESYFESLVAQA